MNKVLEEISKIGILPVVVLEDAKDAKPLAKALCAGGLPCAEVTFRTAAAKESIAIMRKEFPEMLVGAGTVLTVEQVDEALEAGAQYCPSSSSTTACALRLMLRRRPSRLPIAGLPTDPSPTRRLIWWTSSAAPRA